MIHIQPRTGEVEAVGEGSRTGYKICHIKGHFWPFWSILTSKITYQLHMYIYIVQTIRISSMDQKGGRDGQIRYLQLDNTGFAGEKHGLHTNFKSMHNSNINIQFLQHPP